MYVDGLVHIWILYNRLDQIRVLSNVGRLSGLAQAL